MTVHTVGHSNRPVAELCALLRAAACDVVLDVRRFPRSRANPQFNIETLPGALAAVGIGYRPVAALGGRRPATTSLAASCNGSWREAGFRGFADYALTEPFRQALAEVIALTATHRPALMCAEALWWRCHRRIIADYLLAAGLEVTHLMIGAAPMPARLSPNAALAADGVITYPAAPTLL